MTSHRVQRIDSTLLWAARIVGLIVLAIVGLLVLVFLAAFLVGLL